MPNCDLCGKKVEYLNKAIIEGSILNVCGDCGKFGRIIEIPKPIRELPKRRIVTEQKLEEDTIVHDYAVKIKACRESLNMTHEQLANALAEKESVIHNLETGNLIPSIKLAKKLEQFFRIKLIIKQAIGEQSNFNFKNNSLTIGDLLNMKEDE